MTWRAPSVLTRCWLAGPAVAMTWAPRNEPRATSRPPLGHFETDIATAEHDQMRRQVVELQRLDMGERPGGIEAGNARNCCVGADVEENLVTRQHTCAAVIEAYLERLRRHKAPGPHDQLAAGCLVEINMPRNPGLDHIALTLADPCHVGRDRTADYRAETGGVTRQMRDPRAPNLVLAGEAGDIATGAPDPLPLDHGRPSPRSRQMPSHLLAALATAKDQDFDPFRLRHELPPCTPQSVSNLEHDLAGLVRRAILVSFWIYQWQWDLHLSLSKPAHFFSVLR